MRTVGAREVPSDAYAVNVAANQEVTLEVTSTAGSTLVPYIVLTDPTGRFGQVQGKPPLRITSLSGATYTFVVAAAADSAQVLGDYRLQISARICPEPEPLNAPTSKGTKIAGDECVDPYSPFFGAPPYGADIYRVQVDAPPMHLAIRMQQVSADDVLFPDMAMYSPSDALLVDDIDTIDCTAADSDYECVLIRFLAVAPGAYTLVASAGSSNGGYRLSVGSPQVCRPQEELGALPAAGALSCPGQATTECSGVWYGDTSKTRCAAPLLAIDDEAPENGSPADLYTFTATAGQMVRARLTTDGDAYLYLLGPATAGNPVVAAVHEFFDPAELSATLPVAGTYTLVAADGVMLSPPDEDEGESEAYTLSIEAVSP